MVLSSSARLICARCRRMSRSGNATSNRILRLPRHPGSRAMGMPSIGSTSSYPGHTHHGRVLVLVLAAAAILHREPNLVRVDPRPGQAVIVVGDVHGQLHDVLFLLRDAGFPSEDRIFVFNGDYVDRGAWGLETFLLLLAWKVNSAADFPTRC